MLKGRSVEAGGCATASAGQVLRPPKKLSFREPEIMGYAGSTADRKETPPTLDSSAAGIKLKGRSNGRICRQGELSGSCEDLDLESQAMRIVRTVGQAFEVCHKLSLNSPAPDALEEDYDEDRECVAPDEVAREGGNGGGDVEEEEGVVGGREEGEGSVGQGEVGELEQVDKEEGVKEGGDCGRDTTPDVVEEDGATEASQALDALLLSPHDAPPPSTTSNPLPPSPSSPSGSSGLRTSLDPLQTSGQHSSPPGNAAGTPPGSNPGKRSPVGCGSESFVSQMEGGMRTSGGGAALQHELQMLRERAEQQAQQTRAAVAQVRLLRDQLAAETAARIEAQARTHQLLVHNRELLEHIEALVMHLQEIESKQAPDSGENHQQQHLQQHLHRPQSVTLVPQQISPLCDPQGTSYGYLPELQEAAESLRHQASLLSHHPLMDGHRPNNTYAPPPSSSIYSFTGYQEMESHQFQQQLQAQQQFQRQLIQKLQSLGLGTQYAATSCYQAGSSPFPNQPSPLPGYQSYRTSYSGSPVLRQRFGYPQSPEDQFPSQGSPGPCDGADNCPFIRPLPQVGTLSTTDTDGHTRILGPAEDCGGGTSPRTSSGGTSPRISSSSGGVSPRQDTQRSPSSLGPPQTGTGKRRNASALKTKTDSDVGHARSSTPFAPRVAGGSSAGSGGTLRRPANGPVIMRSTSEKVPNRSELMSHVQRTAWARHTTK